MEFARIGNLWHVNGNASPILFTNFILFRVHEGEDKVGKIDDNEMNNDKTHDIIKDLDK